MDKSISKKQSTMFQGLAIIMMLFHHYFTMPSNLTLLHFFNEDFCMHFAWLCKLCVITFAFISGYGMNHGQNSNEKPDFKLLYKKAGIRILKLYVLLWIIIALFKSIDVFFLHTPIAGSELLLNCLGLFYTYNGAWWYVFFYLIICLLFPVFRFFLTRCIPVYKKIAALGISIIAIGLLYFLSLHFFFPYLYTALLYMFVSLHPPILLGFIVGVLTSEFRILDRLLKPIPQNYVMLLPALATLIIIAVIRWQIATSAAYCTFDFLMIVPIVAAFIMISDKLSFIQNLFHFFGKYSTTMWLTHVIIMGYSYEFLARYTRYVIPFFVAEVMLCLMISIPIHIIYSYFSSSSS